MDPITEDVTDVTDGDEVRDPALSAAGASEALAHLLAVQRTARRVVTELSVTSVDEVGAAVDRALAALGGVLDADRCYVFRVHRHDDVEHASNTHEWCAGGVEAQIEHLQDIPFSTFWAWHGPLRAGEPIRIDDVHALGVDRLDERVMLEGQGIRSLLVVPLVALGELHGFLGIDVVRRRRAFAEGEVELLRTVAAALTATTVRQEATRRAQRARALWDALTRNAADLVAVVTPDGRLRHLGLSWERVGVDVGRAVGRRWDRLVDAEDAGRLGAVAASIADAASPGVPVPLGDFRLHEAPGRWFTGTVVDLRDDDRIAGFVVNVQDVTERRDYERRLVEDALHDPVTGLGNRVMFDDRLHQACLRMSAPDRSLAVLAVDLDRFRNVNVAHGHSVGDQLLEAVGRRLQAAVRPVDTVARFAGDEYLVLLDGIEPAEVGAAVHLIRSAVADPLVVDGTTFLVTASVGAAIASGPGTVPDALVRDAELALERAKHQGRDRAEWFEPADRDSLVRRARIVHRLPQAIADGEIAVAFQPVVELGSGRIVGAEALARWEDTELGRVPPAEFVPVAEELGIVDRLGEHVLDVALSELARWPAHLHVAVNLSPAELARSDLSRRVRSALRRRGIDPRRLCLEVTESMVLADPGRATTTLERLRDLGVRSAIDDFGTGFSSLALLRDLPVDVLKIDRRFVAGLDAGDERDRHLVATVVRLAEDLGMVALAEGVETDAQRRALEEMGCPRAQGYLFGRPEPAADLRPRLAASSPPASSAGA